MSHWWIIATLWVLGMPIIAFLLADPNAKHISSKWMWTLCWPAFGVVCFLAIGVLLMENLVQVAKLSGYRMFWAARPRGDEPKEGESDVSQR